MLDVTDELATIFHQGEYSKYDPGEFIIGPGQRISGLYYIESGLVKNFYYTRFGEESLLSLRKEGDILGLTMAVTGSIMDIVYMPLVTAELWHLPTDKFMSTVKKNPDASSRLINKLVEMYRIHSQHILDLEYRSVRERLIAFLLTMHVRLGEKKSNSYTITAPLRHQDIASYINASRETTSRELSYLRRKGMIEFEQGLITIQKVEKLRDYLEG